MSKATQPVFTQKSRQKLSRTYSSSSSSSSLSLSSLEVSDTQVYGPGMRASLGTAAHFCQVVVLKLRPHSSMQGAFPSTETSLERRMHLCKLCSPLCNRRFAVRKRPSFCRKIVSSLTRVASKHQLSNERTLTLTGTRDTTERECSIDNLLVRIYFIIEMIWWTGLAPWEFEFPFPGSLISTFLSKTLHPTPQT